MGCCSKRVVKTMMLYLNSESVSLDRLRTKLPRMGWLFKYLGLAAAASACGIYAYLLMFSRFGFWDDEGYLMATVRAMLQGHRVYDEIYTLYGPFYYFFEWVLYSVTGAPVTHDFVRCVGLFFWLSTAVLAAGSVLRLTRSFSLAGLALFLVSKVLVFFSGEPGHPEELCIIAIAFLLTVACTVHGRLRDWQAIVFGFLLSVLALTKINVGVYAILAVLLTLLAAHPVHRLQKWAFVLVGVSGLSCAIVIMAPLLSLPWTRNYLCLIVFSILTCLLAAYRTRSDTFITGKFWWLLAITFIIGGIAIVLPFVLHGTTISAMFYVSVLQHKDFAREWFVSAPFSARSTAWSALSFILAAFWGSRRSFLFPTKYFEVGLQLLKATLALTGTAYLIIGYPDDVFGVRLLKLIIPFSWLVMVYPRKVETDGHSFARVFLGFIAVFVALYPFPVASAQLLFALVPLVVVVSVFWHDAVSFAAFQVSGFPWRNARRLFSTMAVVALISLYAYALHRARVKYSALVGLALPGATHIHVTPSTADTYHWVKEKLEHNCDSFFSMPGMFSFYFWTGKDTPTMMMMNDWPGFLNARQQQVIVSDLVRNRTNCIIYNPELVVIFQRGKDLSQSPVAQYIQAHFRETGERNGYHLLVRKGPLMRE